MIQHSRLWGSRAATKLWAESFSNLTIKKNPKAVLLRREWRHYDYTLEVANLPQAPPKPAAASAIRIKREIDERAARSTACRSQSMISQ